MSTSPEGSLRYLALQPPRQPGFLEYYADTYVKQDGAWLYAERLLYVDWIEVRPLS